ncbi:MAG: hypothetical protein IJI20_00490 [Firmicutes bacterium]|nr:hypothetical protein [Bacillota bacterium]
MGDLMQRLEEIGSNPAVMKWSGAIVLAALGFAFMRVRRHDIKSSLAFGAGILGAIVVLSLLKSLLFGG